VTVLPVEGPYSFALSTERFRAFGNDLANAWHEDALYRVVGGREVRLAEAAGGADVEPLDDETRPVAEAVLGFRFELEPFYAFAAGDGILRGLVEELDGFRPPLSPEPFETLVTSISAQQVSLRAAIAIRNRLVDRYGGPHGEHAVGFPARDTVAGLAEDDLFALGYSHRKAQYIVALARSDIDLDALGALPDEEVHAVLRALPGIGEWTVDWFLGRHLARPRAWPAGDLALRKAVARFYRPGEDLSIEETRAMADRFDPFQNLTAHYLLTGARTAAA
jgi:3-methyladenine DNA glycosylase/8-oxoguanine DNA glycosylase